MAEINVPGQQNGKKSRTKKLSTRVDLTPMVDLGFLLITFFIFTTSMSEPKSLKLNLPSDVKTATPNETAEGKTLNLVLSGNNRLLYYMGTDIRSMKNISLLDDGLRQVIAGKKRSVGNKYGNPKGLVVLIKPTEHCSYRNVVQALDEMIINDVGTYIIMDPVPSEMQQIALNNN